MLLSAVSVLVVAQSSSEVPEGLTNNPVYIYIYIIDTTCNVVQFNVQALNVLNQGRVSHITHRSCGCTFSELISP